MRGDKTGDSVLGFFHVTIGLHNTNEHTICAHGMKNHGRAWDDETVISRDGKRNTDGMPATQNQ